MRANFINNINKTNIFSFKALHNEKVKPHSLNDGKVNIEQFNTELADLNNVHCPLCGVKILPQKTKELLLEDAKGIKNPIDFILFFNKNLDSIPEAMKQLLDYSKIVVQEKPGIGLTNFYGELKDKAVVNLKQNVSKGILYLKTELEQGKYSDSDKVLLEECYLRLKSYNDEAKKRFFNDYKTILQDTVAKLDSPNKWQIYDMLKNNVKDSYCLLHVLNYPSDISVEDKSEMIFNQIFNHSTSVVMEFAKIPEHLQDERVNKLLVCKDCNFDKAKQFNFFKSDDSIKRFVTYENDLVKNILDGKLKGSEDYPFMLEGFVKKVTKNQSRIDRDNKLFTSYIAYRLHCRQEKINFLPVEYDGVPCASCGFPTINHDHKLDIYNDIANSNNMWDLLNVIEKNEKVISPKYKFLIDAYRNNLESNPFISQKEMILVLRKAANENLQKTLLEATENLAEQISDKVYINDREKKIVNDFVKIVKSDFYNLDSNEKFPFNDFNILIRNYTANLNSRARMEFIVATKEKVKMPFEIQSLLFPSDTVVSKLHSSLKPIFQSIVNGSVATTDHLIARAKDGSDHVSNCVLMCRDCNKDKSNYAFTYWYRIHPEFNINIKKNIKFIVDLINKGELPGYQSYVKTVSTALNKMTSKKLVLKFDLGKDGQK